MSLAPDQAIAVSELGLGELLSAGLAEPVQISDDDAMGWTGLYLTSLIADRAEVEHSEVWHVLTHLPGNFLDMLQSPEGWDALAAVVCGVFDKQLDDYRTANDKRLDDYRTGNRLRVRSQPTYRDRNPPARRSGAAPKRPRATNAQGQAVEWNGKEWVAAK